MKIFEDKFGSKPSTVIPNAQKASTHYGCIKHVWRRAFETIKKEIENPTNVGGLLMFIDEELNE